VSLANDAEDFVAAHEIAALKAEQHALRQELETLRERLETLCRELGH
jgi:ubiquinone biosynthesis protein UbiJ